jgi:SAM-dependent methyltransferase
VGAAQGSAALARRGARVTGLDVSERQLEHARRVCAGTDVRLVRGDAEATPFGDAAFDLVLADHGAPNFCEGAPLLAEVLRVLRPGGRLSLCTLGRNFFTAGLPAIHTLAELARVRQIGMGSFGERYYTERQMAELFEHAGLTDVRVRRCSFAHLNLSPPVYELARKVEPIVERRLPYLAYNIVASGRKPHGGR